MTDFSTKSTFALDPASLGNASKEDRIASSFVARELDSFYMRKVATFPLLSPEEEVRWTNQYYTCHKKLIEMLSRFTHLIHDVILDLCNQSPAPRFSNLFQGEDDDSPMALDIRQQVDAMVERLSALPSSAFCYSEIANDSQQQLFWKAIEPITLKTAFFMACLDKLNAADHDNYLPRVGRETLLRDINSSTEGMTQAFNTLTERNLRLVISIASKYSSTGMAIADLVQEGNIGLMKSIEHFDCTLGYRFSTYASYWIRQSITKYITNHCRIIRIPANMVAQLANIRKAENELFIKNGMQPTEEEIAAVTGYSVTTIKTLKKMNQQPISLQSFSLDDTTLEDTISDSSELGCPSPNDDENTRMKETIDELLLTLNEREQLVIKLRFGLDNHEQQTFIQIGKMLGISSERVRQLEGNALRKLRQKCGLNLPKKE